MATVLIIDDEQLQQKILKTILEDNAYTVYTASSAEEGLNIIKQVSPDVVLTDMKMSGMSGIELIDAIPDDVFKPTVVVMTAFGTIASAVEAMKKGAFDYLTKPLEKDGILLTVKKALENSLLRRENLRLKDELYYKFKIEGIIGTSPKMKLAMDVIRKTAPANVTVLIYGESGTGKELVARAIHYNSPRKTYPFVAINCAAIPEQLLESELFGYEPGAFTGATTRKIGLIESANKGSLFLDEIAELPPLMQSKLLRVLQDKEIRRLGAKDNIKVDVRVIAATNKRLDIEVAEGRFREDLFYRLKVVTVELPPLRERKEDIRALINFFIAKYNKEFGRRITDIKESAVNLMLQYHWPGNIRQLEAVIERAVLMADGNVITSEDIKSELSVPSAKSLMDMDIPDEGINFEELEKNLIKKAMAKSNNVAAKAARLLGMSYKTFWYRLEKFGLSSKEQQNP